MPIVCLSLYINKPLLHEKLSCRSTFPFLITNGLHFKVSFTLSPPRSPYLISALSMTLPARDPARRVVQSRAVSAMLSNSVTEPCFRSVITSTTTGECAYFMFLSFLAFSPSFFPCFLFFIFPSIAPSYLTTYFLTSLHTCFFTCTSSYHSAPTFDVTTCFPTCLTHTHCIALHYTKLTGGNALFGRAMDARLVNNPISPDIHLTYSPVHEAFQQLASRILRPIWHRAIAAPASKKVVMNASPCTPRTDLVICSNIT